MRIIKFFIILCISILPFNYIRIFFYNLFPHYKIDKESYIGWFSLIICENFKVSNCNIDKFNFIFVNNFDGKDSNINKMNKFFNINTININQSKIGNKNKFIGEPKISSETKFYLGLKSKISDNNYFDLTHDIEIYENCYLGSHIQIWTHGFNEKREIKTKNVFLKKGCVIKDACLISMGVTIGENAIAEIGSVITRDLDENSFYYHELQKH